MARVKRAVNAQKKRRTTLARAEGYRGQRSRLYRKAKEQVTHSLGYAYRDRKARKGDFRRLWIQRINAASREQRPDLQPLRARSEGVGGRGRPSHARRARGQRPEGVRVAGRDRQGGAARPTATRRAGLIERSLTDVASPELTDIRVLRGFGGFGGSPVVRIGLEQRQFLAEGAQAVREALSAHAEGTASVDELLRHG